MSWEVIHVSAFASQSSWGEALTSAMSSASAASAPMLKGGSGRPELKVRAAPTRHTARIFSAAPTPSGSPHALPSSPQVAETWDLCIENTVRKLAYGTIAGGLAAMILFRSPAARSAIAGLGAGVGVGMGYTDCKHEFDAIGKAGKK